MLGSKTCFSSRHMRRAAGALILPWVMLAPPSALADPLGQLIERTDPALAAAMKAYRLKLAEYERARAAFEAEAEAYWTQSDAKRKERIAKQRRREPLVADDYVLTQPPRYAGPPHPIDPSAPEKKPPERPRKFVPVIADFLREAARHYKFVPQRPASERDFKRAYARAAAAAGLTRDQVVRIYAFETGGNGGYDLQAGLEYKPNARAISTALGYNQLLHVNSIGLIAEKGDRILALLNAKAATLDGAAKATLAQKIAALRRMIAVARSVPNRWSAHETLGDTPKGYAIQAVLLDIDIGPLLQVEKLRDSVAFARRKGVTRPLAGAELEIMNFTGDGNGYEIVVMPDALRAQVPTANFYRRMSYERNPVVIRNNTVAKLLAAIDSHMDRASKKPGAQELAAAFPN